jgi:hypothetical protein
MTHEEEMALRELAANPHYIAKVTDILGPLSLWSSQGLQDYVRKAVEAEREACAKVCDDHIDGTPEWNSAANNCAAAIRAREQA